jgi:uncharacterized protein (TIGR03085 family)
MATIAQYERSELADLFDEIGPSAPTLCGDWTTRELAAHLVVRERRPDAAGGIRLGLLSGYLEHVQTSYADKPWDELVSLVRRGAPPWSLFALPPLDRLLNTAEYFVHHEDVRRAQPDWAPRELPSKVQDALWQVVKGRAALGIRGTSCGVLLRRPDGRTHVAKKGEPVAEITGEPAELLLYLFGRRDHALVEIGGPPEAQAALAGAALEL